MTNWDSCSPEPKKYVRETKAQLVEKAKAALELKRRYEQNKLYYYRPCGQKHNSFHTSKAGIRVVFGGNRSGKSVAGLIELLFAACLPKHPYTKVENRRPGRYRVFCSDFAVIEKLILPMVQEWIPIGCLQKAECGNKLEAFKESYDPRYHLLTLKDGTTIDFLSYDQDASKAESVELDGVWADEEMPERLYAATLARLVSRGGKFWMTVTPLYSLSWAMSFLEADDPNIEVFQFSIFDNPHLNAQAINDFIATVPEHERKARIDGQFMEFEGLVYKELRRDAHIILPDSKLPYFHWPVIMAMDPHPRKATVIVWAYVDPQDCVVFFDELELKGTAFEIVQAIKEKEATHRARTFLRLIDPAARAQGSNIAGQTDTLREFEKEGMGFTLADNSEAGYNVVHEYLAFDQEKPLSSLNRPKCRFTTDVTKTWYGMRHLLWDEWNQRRALKDEKERIKDYKKDFPDCVRYTLATRPQHMNSLTSSMLGNYKGRTYKEDKYSDFRQSDFSY